jgi:hypothetical protein
MIEDKDPRFSVHGALTELSYILYSLTIWLAHVLMIKEVQFPLDLEVRGKSRSCKWVYGCLLKSGRKRYVVKYERGRRHKTRVYPETVGRSSERNDRNGMEVYEDDIISTPESPHKAIVVWEENQTEASFWYSPPNDWNRLGELLIPFENIAEKDMEVIGNYHDNPDWWK